MTFDDKFLCICFSVRCLLLVVLLSDARLTQSPAVLYLAVFLLPTLQTKLHTEQVISEENQSKCRLMSFYSFNLKSTLNFKVK